MLKFLSICSFILPFALLASDATRAESLKEGAAIYKVTCVSCHGVDGETNKAMQLVVNPRKLDQTILTQAQSFKVIKEGGHHWGAHSDLMPAFKYIYSDKQIDSIALYITETFNPNRNEKVQKLLQEAEALKSEDEAKIAKKGKKIFKRNCSMCHGISGNGESEYVEQSKADNTFIYPYNLQRTLLTEDQIFLYAKFGGHYWGTDKDDMPSWKKKYDDFTLKSVARYITRNIVKLKE